MRQTSLPYVSSHDFRSDCEDQFRLHAEEHQWHYPAASLSHLCIRTKNHDHLEQLLKFSQEIGVITVNYKDSDPEKTYPIWFVELHDPLTDGDLTADFLAITMPKPEMPFTGTQLVVGTDSRLSPHDHHDKPSQLHDRVVLKCQKSSAAQILKAAPKP